MSNKILISCEMPDFNSAELAMRNIVRIDSDNIKFSITRKKIFDEDDVIYHNSENNVLISALPYSLSASFPVASVNSVKNQGEEYKFKESCNLLISCRNIDSSRKIISKLRSFGAYGLKRIKY